MRQFKGHEGVFELADFRRKHFKLVAVKIDQAQLPALGYAPTQVLNLVSSRVQLA